MAPSTWARSRAIVASTATATPQVGADIEHRLGLRDQVRVTITAGPDACADCLVPENLMRGILGQALGVPQDAIDLAYPSTPSAPEKERP